MIELHSHDFARPQPDPIGRELLRGNPGTSAQEQLRDPATALVSSIAWSCDLVPRERLELPTCGLGNRRSVLLSYRGIGGPVGLRSFEVNAERPGRAVGDAAPQRARSVPKWMYVPPSGAIGARWPLARRAGAATCAVMAASPRSLLLLRTLFWAALAFAIVMATLPKPPHLPIDSLGDKFEHMLAFATLAGLGSAAFPRIPLPRLGERLSFLGALIEVVQSVPALHRDCDITDWVADTCAVAIVLLIAWGLRGRRAGRLAGRSSPG